MAAFARALATLDGADTTTIAPDPSGPLPIVSAPAVGYTAPPEATGPFEVAPTPSGPIEVAAASSQRITTPGPHDVALSPDFVEPPRPAVPAAAWISGIVVAAAVAGGLAWWLAGASGRGDDRVQTAATAPKTPRATPDEGNPAASGSSATTTTQGDDEDGTEPSAAPADDEAADAGDDTGAAAAGSDETARGLTRAQIDKTLAKAQVKLMACRGPIFGGKAGDRVRVQLTVRGRDGKVVGAKPTGPHARSKLGGCVAAELRKLGFPPFARAKQRFHRTVQL